MSVQKVKLRDGREVYLGANIDPERKAKLHFEDYINLNEATPPPPKTEWGKNATRSLNEPYGNTKAGCCVISGKAHKVGVATAADSDSGGEVVSNDDEVLKEYRRICGPGDNGCNVPAVLDEMMRNGILVGGKKHKISGYVDIDPTNKQLIMAAIALLGPLDSEINLPSDWTCTNCVWKVTNSRTVGGHDVCFYDYDEQFVYGSTWGGICRVTWDAFTSGRWVTGLYATLSPDWTNLDNLSPGGVNVEKLTRDLEALGGGDIPDVPPVGPTPTPTPPTPTPPSPWDWIWKLIWAIIEWFAKAQQRDQIQTKVQALPWQAILALLLKLLEEWLKQRGQQEGKGDADQAEAGGSAPAKDPGASKKGNGRTV